jgi:chromosomal replication initiation ATPase DnaA
MIDSNRKAMIRSSVSLINRLKEKEFNDQYELLRDVCNEAGLSMGDVLYKRGNDIHSLTRHALWYLFREKFEWGPSRIMRETGRDHSTVIYALNNFDNYMNGSNGNTTD